VGPRAVPCYGRDFEKDNLGADYRLRGRLAVQHYLPWRNDELASSELQIMLRIKSGVAILGMVPQLTLAIAVLSEIYRRLNVDLVITAGSDGSHSGTSEHYAGRAMDFRVNNLPEGTDIDAIVKEAQDALGPDFYFQKEADHIHAHYRPIKPST
jgi:hypothetical protein